MLENPEIPENDTNNYTKVYCRFRPVNKHELEFSPDKISSFSSDTILNINTLKEKDIFDFTFDKIFKPDSTQQEIYENSAKKSVENFLIGYNSVIITHGQNGSGKSYTMTGNIDNNDLKGIIPRAVKDIFEYIYDRDNFEFIIKASIIDIYKDKIRDLIIVNEQNIISINQDEEDINKKGIIINLDGITEKYVSNEAEVLKILETGINNKTKLDNNININGQFAKSNFLFILKLIQNNKKEGTYTKSEIIFLDSSGEENKIHNFFEKLSNGNYRTSFIITCSSSIFNQATTLQFLRFGEKMKKIKNNAIINQLLSYEKLEEKMKEAELKIKQLEHFISFQNKISKENNKNNINLSFDEQIKSIIDLISKNNNFGLIKDNVINQINNLSNKYNKDIESLNIIIKEDDKEKNDIKYNLQQALIKQQAINKENINKINEFINELKQNKELNTLMKQISEFEKKLKSSDLMRNIDINTNKKNNFIIEENINFSYISDNNIINIDESKMKSDKDINNNINKEKLLKIELNKDNDIKYLSVCLDENKDIILELKKEILSLQNKIKILENNALLSERKIRDKNLILENNILELKKKYEDSQIKRLILEDNCRRLRKVISNKKINLVNSKEESINRSLKTPKNLIKVLVGGEDDKF